MMNLNTSIYVALGVLFVACHGNTQELTSADRRNRFELYTQCGDIYFNSALSYSAAQIDLTEADIDGVVESALAHAEVLANDVGNVALNATAIISDSGGYTTRLALEKWVNDEAYTDTWGWATTWERIRAGTVSTKQDILSDISLLLDDFIPEYMQVNEAACNPSASTTSTTPECYASSVTSPTPLMGQTDEVITLLDGSKWEVGIGHYNYLYAYYPRVVVCPTEQIMFIREAVGDEATELRVTKL